MNSTHTDPLTQLAELVDLMAPFTNIDPNETTPAVWIFEPLHGSIRINAITTMEQLTKLIEALRGI